MKLITKLIASATLVVVSANGFHYLKENEKIYSSMVMPCVHALMDGEQAHNFAIKMAKYGIVPNKASIQNEDCLRVNVFQKQFDNPLGCAAGFDKNGEAMGGLFKMGFGFVEIGTITKEPQEGNPKPRVFRLSEDKAVINRYGFNSEGHQAVLERVKAFESSKYRSHGILGINIGKNKLSTDATEDYLAGVRTFAPYADYLVINISSPNTPGLRSLQNKKQLEELVDPILELRNKIEKQLPIIVKIAPDLDDAELQDIAQVLTRKNKKVDGIVISNTTIQRPSSLDSTNKSETGGLSGRPLKELSNQATKRFYELTRGELLIIGAGGIETGHDALERIKSGASLVQIYTAMVYEGPVIVNKIKRELVQELNDQGFKNISDAIGANVKLNN